MGVQQGQTRAAGPCWSPVGLEPRAGSMLLSTFISTAPEKWGLLFHGPSPQLADRDCLRFPEELHSHGDPMGSACRSLSVLVLPVTSLPVTDMASCHQLAMQLWRASLAMGQCPSASLVGHGAGTWGQGAPWNAGSMSTVTNSQVGPAGSASLSDALWDPSWPCGGSVAGAYMEMLSKRERKLSTQSQKYGPCLSSKSISSSHQCVMACHVISSSCLTTHLPFHLE